VVSHAKAIGYTAKSRKSSVAKLRVVVSDVPSGPETMTLPKHTAFKSILNGREYTFYTLNSTTATRTSIGYTYEVDVTEGRPGSNYYENVIGSNFVVPVRDVDLSTLVVNVQETRASTNIEQFRLVDDLLTIKGIDSVYFIKQREDLFYEIYFGNGTIGKNIDLGNVVYLDYMISSGVVSNGCSQFYYSSGFRGDALYQVTTIESAIGGADSETVESVKFNAPRNFISQNRAVTAEDYQVQILSNFPQVQSISVWGGQDNVPRQYGRVFISAKPYGRDALNAQEKEEINEFLSQKRSILSIQQVFVDPIILEIGFESNVYYDQTKTTKTSGEIDTIVRAAVQSYSDGLNTFNSSFRFSQLSRLIDTSDESIVSNISSIYLRRTVKPSIGISTTYQIQIGNPLLQQAGYIKSSKFYTFGFTNTCIIQNDESGNLFLYEYYPDGTSVKRTKCGTVDYGNGIITVDNIIITGLYDPKLTFKIIPKSNDVIPVRQNILVMSGELLKVNTIVDSSSYSNNFVFSASR
jgi:hypothetical protein